MKAFILALMTISLSTVSMANTLPSLLSEAEVNEIMCGETQTIKGHMQEMSQLIDDLSNLVDDVLDEDKAMLARPVIVEKTQRLRIHLSSVFTKRADKLYQIDPNDVRRAQLIFQQYLIDVISKTIEVEHELLDVPQNPIDMQSQRVKVAKLLLDIQNIVKEAHDKFRQ